jgi:hypothetical protein
MSKLWNILRHKTPQPNKPCKVCVVSANAFFSSEAHVARIQMAFAKKKQEIRWESVLHCTNHGDFKQLFEQHQLDREWHVEFGEWRLHHLQQFAQNSTWSQNATEISSAMQQIQSKNIPIVVLSRFDRGVWDWIRSMLKIEWCYDTFHVPTCSESLFFPPWHERHLHIAPDAEACIITNSRPEIAQCGKTHHSISLREGIRADEVFERWKHIPQSTFFTTN